MIVASWNIIVSSSPTETSWPSRYFADDRVRKRGELINVHLSCVRPAAEDTNFYELARPMARRCPGSPGAHIDLHLRTA